MIDRHSFGSTAFLLIPIVGVLVSLFVLSMIGYMYFGSRQMLFAIQGDQLVIKAPVYGRTVPLSALKLDQVRVGKLGDSPDLQPVRRTGGMALGQVKLGRFHMADGSSTYMYIHAGGSCVIVPTTEGYTLVMEAAQPNELLAALKNP